MNHKSNMNVVGESDGRVVLRSARTKAESRDRVPNTEDRHSAQGGEHFSIDIPFYRTFPISRLIAMTSGVARLLGSD
jgi:hypothetical protein